jgi:hypothetical protein
MPPYLTETSRPDRVGKRGAWGRPFSSEIGGAKVAASRVRDLPVARIGYFFRTQNELPGVRTYPLRENWVFSGRSTRVAGVCGSGVAERGNVQPTGLSDGTTPIQTRACAASCRTLRRDRARRCSATVPVFRGMPTHPTLTLCASFRYARERAHTLCVWLGPSSHRRRCSSARRSSIHRRNSGHPVIKASCERSTSASQREHEAARRVRPQRLQPRDEPLPLVCGGHREQLLELIRRDAIAGGTRLQPHCTGPQSLRRGRHLVAAAEVPSTRPSRAPRPLPAAKAQLAT